MVTREFRGNKILGTLQTCKTRAAFRRRLAELRQAGGSNLKLVEYLRSSWPLSESVARLTAMSDQEVRTGQTFSLLSRNREKKQRNRVERTRSEILCHRYQIHRSNSPNYIGCGFCCVFMCCGLDLGTRIRVSLNESAPPILTKVHQELNMTTQCDIVGHSVTQCDIV